MATRRSKSGGLKKLQGKLLEYVPPAVFAGAELIAVEAQISIVEGSVSGKGHVPSAPGSPPNANLRTLDGNIEATHPSPFRALASSNAPYAAMLEFGTSKMAARPYMAPAVARTRRRVTETISAAVKKAVRQSEGS